MNGGARLVLAMLAGLWLLPAQARTLAEIKQGGELRICVAGSSAAYYQTNGEDFARVLGVRAKTQVLPSWDHQFHNAQGVTVQDGGYEAALLASGRCDLYPNDLHMTAWRQQKMSLVPYFTTRTVVVAQPALRGVLRQAEDLAGRTAAVQAGTAYESWLRSLNATQLGARPVVIQTAPTAQSMRRVAERRADFTVIAAESAFKWVREDLDNLDILFATGESAEVGWGVGQNATGLAEALAQYFEASRRVGSRLDLSWRKNYGISLVEYALFSDSFDERARLLAVWSTWGVPICSALAGVFLAMLFWTRRLRREVARHRIDAEALRASEELMAREAARRQAVSDLLLALQQVESLPAFGQTVLCELGRWLPLGQGLFATVDAAHGVQAQAHYAGGGATPAATLVEFPTTMGLVDRCVATGEAVLVMQPGADYLRIRSGLGNGAPAAILVLPVQRAGQVVAIVELALAQDFAPGQRQLIDAFAQIVAVSLTRFQQALPEHATPAPRGVVAGNLLAGAPT